jgi:hypothetical protein
MRNILKLHSGTQSGTMVSPKKYHIFDDFENYRENLIKITCKKIFKKNYFSEKNPFWNILMEFRQII